MTKRKQHSVSEVFRKDMRFRLDHPYRRREKYPSDTECPECGLLFQDGVWKRGVLDGSREVHHKLCPACLQIRDDYSGGRLRASGSFVEGHRQEILNRIRNVARETGAERPLERLMRIEERPHEIVVYATGEHLIARLGKALRRDFGGELALKYSPEDKFATADWSREAG
jgi:hypothetical protein